MSRRSLTVAGRLKRSYSLVPFAIVVATLAATPLILSLSGCGGSGSSDTIGNPTDPTPTPTSSVSPTPTPSESPTTSPSASPTPTPTPPPLSGATLTVNQAVIGISNPSSDLNTSTDTISPYDNGFTIGASRPTLSTTGTAAQVFFSSVEGNLIRSVTIVVANASGVQQGTQYSIGGVVSQVTTRNAFVLYTTREVGDTTGATDKQWASVSGLLVVDSLSSTEVKLRIVGAVMQPYTANKNNGQTGTFSIAGAGYSAITQ